jgi:glyoxylase-like metal-dependent hydrolase (beta-lactamase superfamily II)
VDTGLESSLDYILHTARDHFGKNAKPNAIILTHGHFDHIGSIKELLKLWNVPVYAHEEEMPYLTGKKDYPQGDPQVDEGMVAELSPYFPHNSIDLGNSIHALPEDGTIPHMDGWRWIHTPGHTPGHISFFRERDGVLIVGDAFSTVKQESMMAVMNQSEQISGPPKYLTTDWEAAENSVKKLASLNLSLAIPSHGMPMGGEELRRHLEMLTQNFDTIAVPQHGRFVE